jgi:single-strand DNA-binding protein
MATFNKFISIGKLIKDPHAVNISGDNKLVKFTIVTSKKVRDKEISSFFDCIAFGKKAEIIIQHMKKGREIFIDGEMEQDNWEDKETKQKRSKLVVRVNDFDFVD